MSTTSTRFSNLSSKNIVQLKTQNDANLQSGGGTPCACRQSLHPVTSTRSHTARLLVVEDHADTARVMARLLQKLGYEVVIAPDVKTALEAAAAAHFDLVISDLGLPDGSGLDLMKDLRSRHHLKGIAVTGYGMPQDIEESRAAGFIAHLLKPLDLQKLENTLRQLVI